MAEPIVEVLSQLVAAARTTSGMSRWDLLPGTAAPVFAVSEAVGERRIVARSLLLFRLNLLQTAAAEHSAEEMMMAHSSVQSSQSDEASAQEALVLRSSLVEQEKESGTESAASAADPDLVRLQSEAPTPGRLIQAMDRYLPTDPQLQAFALDYDERTFRQFSAGMQRITMQALLLQRAPSYEVFRDRLVEHVQGQDGHASSSERTKESRQPGAALVKVPTAASLLRYMVAIFGGPRAQKPNVNPPLTAADLDAFISTTGAGHILNPGMDTTHRLTRLLTVKKPGEILAALREWARINLAPYEDLLVEDLHKPEGFWHRLKMIATAVPEQRSLVRLLVEVFRDPFELDLFCTVAFPRTYHRAVRSNKDRAEALASWIWTGLVWDKLKAYLSLEVLEPYEKDLTLRSDLQRLTVWGTLMATIAILSTKLEEIREQLSGLQEKYKGTFIGMIAATLLSGMALLYWCNPLQSRPPIPTAAGTMEASAVSGSPGSKEQPPHAQQTGSPDPKHPTERAPGCSADRFCREAIPVVSHHLRRVFGTPDGHLFAAGDSGTLLHYDGSSWSNVSPPLVGKPAALVGLFGTSATDLWVAGHGSTLLHFGMTGWEPQVLSTPADLQSLWGGGGELWAVGQKGILLQHKLGTWSAVDIADDHKATLSTLFGTGPRDLWAVGSGGAILHFDGEQWSPSPSGTQRPLYAVWGSGPADVWAVGEYGTILHFDGKAWALRDAGAPWFANALHGVWGHGGSEVWIVGTKGLVLRYDGNRWQPLLSGVQTPLRDVWVSPGGDVWIVGNEGLVLRRLAAG